MFPHQLPPLPYPYNGLEPYLDAKTMEIHHAKHHQAYVDNLNKALQDYPIFHTKSVEQLLRDINSVPQEIRQQVINHGGGHSNHTFFWQIMAPKAGGAPSGQLAETIASAFGSFQNFKEQFAKAALGRFGSGWAWLVKDQSGKLLVYSTANQDSPLMQAHTPLLGIDVWEHSYYLKHLWKRAEYINDWWNVVNWSEVARRYEQNW